MENVSFSPPDTDSTPSMLQRLRAHDLHMGNAIKFAPKT